MKKIIILLAIIIATACSHTSQETGAEMITVSIAPFKYFVDRISGGDFKVNIMVPPGSNPHIYEPYPEQVNKLRKSVAYISDGFMGFENTWLEKFYETNKKMVKLSLGDKITPIVSDDDHGNDHFESRDPHYWVSPKSAKIIAASIKDLLCYLNPDKKEKYGSNYNALIHSINEVDSVAGALFSEFPGRSFMIYHPNLAYLARDYNLEEVAVEFEGKEPTPSRMKYLIDLARERNIKTIFVQKEHDAKNARAIAVEIGAEIKTIDPLSEDWMKSTLETLNALDSSFIKSRK
jgi:zinc transport system substrate-binding protein